MKPSTNSVKTNTSGFGLCLVLFLSLTFNLPAQSYEGLTPLESYQTKTYYSAGSEKHAIEMAERCDNVVSFYKKHIDFEPTVTLLVLSKEDWSKHTNFPVYGMPHYTDSNTLIVASEDNEFWKSFIPPIEQLPGELAQQIKATYSDEEGNLSMRAFFDLLAIHELGHAFHIQGGLVMQRKWMGELFANIFLHTYIAEQEPELLPALTIFPRMVVSSTDKNELAFTTLNELETDYQLIGQRHPNNYGWYQCRWHMAAGNIYDEGGIEVYINLWYALKNQKEVLDDPSFATLLANQVHQSVADVQLKWDE
jgi:hypothetical protein